MNKIKQFFRNFYSGVRQDLDAIMLFLNLLSNRIQNLDDTMSRVEKAVTKTKPKTKAVKSSKKK